MVPQKIMATFATAALFGLMAPTTHAQAHRGGGASVGHAAPHPGPAHPGGPGPGPAHPIYGRPGYGYGRYYHPYYPYYPYYRYPSYPYYGYGYGGFSFSVGFGFGYGYPYSYPYYAYGSPYSYYPYPYAAPGAYPALPSYGGIRIDVPQKDAQVFADGYLAGRVGDFDSSKERLALPAGSHRIEIRAQGSAQLIFDVNIEPGQTILYRDDLRRPQQPPSPPQ